MTHLSERERQIPDLFIEKLSMAKTGKKFISLGPGEPDFPAPKPVVDYVKKMAPFASRYAPPGGIPELREALAKKFKRENNVDAQPENIVVTCGSQEALVLSIAATADVGEEIILPNPSYMLYLPDLQIFNTNPVFLELKEREEWNPNPDEIKKLITSKTVALLLNSPANPTGNVIPRKIWEEIADIAVDHDIYIFSDEAYEHIIYDGAKNISPASLNGMEDYVVTFNTFSKSYSMCGYRVGYVLAPPKLAEAIQKSHVYTTIAAPTISQFAALKAVTMGLSHVNQVVKEYDKRRKMLVGRLNEIGLTTHMPRGAFYTFSNIRSFSNNSRQFAEKLFKEKQVAVMPGSDFGRAGEGFIRCSYATEYNKIEEAMDRIEKFLKK